MSNSALANISLGYQALWTAKRRLGSIRLRMARAVDAPVHAADVLASFRHVLSASPHGLLLATDAVDLLCDLLDHAQGADPWIEIKSEWLRDEAVRRRVVNARRHGVRMIWRGAPGELPDPMTAESFPRQILNLDAGQALDAMKAARLPMPGGLAPRSAVGSPVRKGQIYIQLPGSDLINHCLDQGGASAIIGWPVEAVLHDVGFKSVQPLDSVITSVQKAIDADESTERLEQLLYEDPVLTYRLLIHVNSASIGLRSGIDSIRNALMMMGVGSLRNWLTVQRKHEKDDLNHQPVSTMMVLRGRLLTHLLDAGIDSELRGEIHLCGLFSQLDLLLGQPQADILHRLPLPERIVEATLGFHGPYGPYLEIARAMEGADLRLIPSVCENHEVSRVDVNRALLKMVASIPMSGVEGLDGFSVAPENA